MNAPIRIGEVANWVGLPEKTIRYYEDIGLVAPIRSENGYRQFRMSDIQSLKIIKGARDLGFTIEDSRTLLSLFLDANRTSSEVKALASRQLEKTQDKIKQLVKLSDLLSHLTNECQGNGHADCAILNFLAGAKN